METKLKASPVSITLETVTLKGILAVPDQATGIVIFSHGSGSSRLSSRNNYVASVLQKEGMATLLFDLLTEREDLNYETRFNIPLLTERLVSVTQWIGHQKETKALAIGYFGASTGAASALGAAAHYGADIAAVVSRGGRPDLALDILDGVMAPTLYLVGELDQIVIGLNKKAFDKTRAPKRMDIIPGASHLFEEPGTLEEVAKRSAQWFKKHFENR